MVNIKSKLIFTQFFPFLAQQQSEELAEERFEYAIDIDDYNDYEYNEEDFDFEPSSKPKKKRKYNTKKPRNKKKIKYQEPDSDAGGDERPIDDDIISTQKIPENKEESVKKMLACNHCHKEFPTPSKLKRHVSQIHEGIKNYQCDRCDRAFGELCKLKKHVSIVHEGQKNYQCDRCDYRCGQLSNLKKHISIVHEGVRKYQCDQVKQKQTFFKKQSNNSNNI